MIKTILAQVREYRLSTVLAPLFTVGEVVLEVLIPFVTASIIDKGIQANIQQVYLYGGLMLLMALLSLVCGVLAGRFAAKASSGLACNLRESIYEKVPLPFQHRQVQHSRSGNPYDHRCDQRAKRCPNAFADCGAGAADAGVQHGIRIFSLFNDRVLHVLLAGKDGTALEGGEGFPNFLQLPAIFQQGETSA